MKTTGRHDSSCNLGHWSHLVPQLVPQHQLVPACTGAQPLSPLSPQPLCPSHSPLSKPPPPPHLAQVLLPEHGVRLRVDGLRLRDVHLGAALPREGAALHPIGDVALVDGREEGVRMCAARSLKFGYEPRWEEPCTSA